MVELVMHVEPDARKVEDDQLWRVFMRRADVTSGDQQVWVELGTIESKYTHRVYDDELQKAGELGGSGDYMIVRVDLARVQLFTLQATTTYVVVGDEFDEAA